LGRYVNSRVFSSAALDVLGASLNLKKGTSLKVDLVDQEEKIAPESKETPRTSTDSTVEFNPGVGFETQQENMLFHLMSGGRVKREKSVLEDDGSESYQAKYGKAAMLEHLSMAWDDRIFKPKVKNVPRESLPPRLDPEEVAKFQKM